MSKSLPKDPAWPGFFYLLAWGSLITAGIVAKRVYNHPNWMILFHLPAAVFLVLGMRFFSAKNRKKYEEQIQRYKAQT